jgi:hypothetical protein
MQSTSSVNEEATCRYCFSTPNGTPSVGACVCTSHLCHTCLAMLLREAIVVRSATAHTFDVPCPECKQPVYHVTRVLLQAHDIRADEWQTDRLLTVVQRQDPLPAAMFWTRLAATASSDDDDEVRLRGLVRTRMRCISSAVTYTLLVVSCCLYGALLGTGNASLSLDFAMCMWVGLWGVHLLMWFLGNAPQWSRRLRLIVLVHCTVCALLVSIRFAPDAAPGPISEAHIDVGLIVHAGIHALVALGWVYLDLRRQNHAQSLSLTFDTTTPLSSSPLLLHAWRASFCIGPARTQPAAIYFPLVGAENV